MIPFGHNAGQRFTARQIARAKPSGPERPNRMENREPPVKLIVASIAARSNDPTRKSAAVLPSQSIALTRAGEAIFPPEKPGIMRDEIPQINNVMKPTVRPWRIASMTKKGDWPNSMDNPSTMRRMLLSKAQM